MKTLFVLLFLLPIFCISQNKEIESTSPEYIGGSKAMSKFIVNNFNYPEKDYKKRRQGTIWIEFIITNTGDVTNVKVVKGVSKRLNKESIRVVSMMPKWKPGTQKGKKVNVRYTIPIKAKLGDAYQKTKRVKLK